MPELPEVEAARRLVEAQCAGKRIKTVEAAADDKVFDGCSPEDLTAALQGKVLLGVQRKGKYLWLVLDQPGPVPLMHFGMTGAIIVEGVGAVKYINTKLDDSGSWPPRFTKLQLDFEDGTRLAFTDPRRFARVKLLDDPTSQPPVSKLGFDPLTSMPDVEEFGKLLAARRSAKLKALLLDQAFSAGVGNWVADEVLYQARLHPEQPTGDLGPEHVAALHAALVSVVQVAVAAGADSAEFPPDWLFHFRWTGKKASSVGGHKIDFITVGSRTSAYVPVLQKLLAGGGAGSGGGKARASKEGRASKAAAKKRSKAAQAEGDGNGAEAGAEEGEGEPGAGKKPAARKRSKTAASKSADEDAGKLVEAEAAIEDGSGEPQAPAAAAKPKRSRSTAGGGQGRKGGKGGNKKGSADAAGGSIADGAGAAVTAAAAADAGGAGKGVDSGAGAAAEAVDAGGEVAAAVAPAADGSSALAAGRGRKRPGSGASTRRGRQGPGKGEQGDSMAGGDGSKPGAAAAAADASGSAQLAAPKRTRKAPAGAVEAGTAFAAGGKARRGK